MKRLLLFSALMATVFFNSNGYSQDVVVNCDESTNTQGFSNIDTSSNVSAFSVDPDNGCYDGNVATGLQISYNKSLDPVLVANFDFEVQDDLIDLGTLDMYARYGDGTSLGAQIEIVQAAATSTPFDCSGAMKVQSGQFVACEVKSMLISGFVQPYINLKGGVSVVIKNYEGPEALLGMSVSAATGSHEENTFLRKITAGGPAYNAVTQGVSGKETDSSGRPAIYIDKSGPTGGYTAGFVVNFPYLWTTLVSQAVNSDQNTNFEANGGAVGSNSGVALRISYEPIF